MLRLLTSSSALVVVASGVAIAAPCTQVALKPDQSSIILQGKTTGSDTDFTCFQLATGAGRRLHLKLLQPAAPGLGFTILDVVDNQTDYSFVTGRDSYKIAVYGIFRASPVQPFRISVTASASGNAQGADQKYPAETMVLFGQTFALQPFDAHETAFKWKDVKRDLPPLTLSHPELHKSREQIEHHLALLEIRIAKDYQRQLKDLTPAFNKQHPEMNPDQANLALAAIFNENRGSSISPEVQKIAREAAAITYLHEMVRRSMEIR
jgi:hypothetical protein